MKNLLPWIAIGIGLGFAIAWWIKPSPEMPYQPLFDARAEIRYIYVPDTTKPVSVKLRQSESDPTAHPFTAIHEDFEIKGVCYGVKVTGLDVHEVEFTGEANIRAYPDRIETTPRTPGLTLTVTAYKAKKKPRGRLFQLDFLAGAQMVPPYLPTVGVGFGFRRIPFTRIRVPFTLGGAWMGNAPGLFLVWRW